MDTNIGTGNSDELSGKFTLLSFGSNSTVQVPETFQHFKITSSTNLLNKLHTEVLNNRFDFLNSHRFLFHM